MTQQLASSPEEWRPIAGYQDWYEVSNLGRVRRACGGSSTHAGYILKARPRRGYLRVRLYKGDGIGHGHSVHRLVSNAFVPKRQEANDINHRDNDRTNNCVSNLEWVSPAENSAHAIAIGAFQPAENQKRARRTSCLTERQVLEIRATGRSQTQEVLGQRYGVHPNTIGRILNRRRWADI